MLDLDLIYEFDPPGAGRLSLLGDSVCAITEDIDIQVLYSAYMQGVFPWFSEEDGEPVIWHSPDPRFVLFPKDFHVPKSIKKFLKKSPYRYSMDEAFEDVISECSKMSRSNQDGTWIGEKIINAYTELHKEGLAHSIEVWDEDGKLCGGFYGVLIGSVFCGESMFTYKSDSSKSAFVLFMEAFFECGGVMLDSQVYTDNIARYGAKNISRSAFLKIESDALKTPLKGKLRKVFLEKCQI